MGLLLDVVGTILLNAMLVMVKLEDDEAKGYSNLSTAEIVKGEG